MTGSRLLFGGSERDAAQNAMHAALKAGNRVRDGFRNWMRGAPTHVLAEFLSELEADGWCLVPSDSVQRLESERADLAQTVERVKLVLDGWRPASDTSTKEPF